MKNLIEYDKKEILAEEVFIEIFKQEDAMKERTCYYHSRIEQRNLV